MPKLPNFQTLLLLGFICLLGLAALLWGLRQGARDGPAAGDSHAGSAASSADSATQDGSARSREPRTRRSGGAPAISSSEAVAALVGDASLSDAEAAAGLQRIVEDAARPMTERLEALDHVLNLASNDQPAMLHELAARRVQPDEVRLRLLAEALNRPVRLQGEILVELLENAAGEVRREVLLQLKGLCDEDLGEDPAAWRAAVAKLPSL